MKSNTIKWRIFKYNLLVIILLIAFVAIVFNLSIRVYFEKDLIRQLSHIASRIEDTALRRGPDIFMGSDRGPGQPPIRARETDDVFRFYFMLGRSLREPLSLLNADYILLDNNKNIIDSPFEWFSNTDTNLLKKISSEINKSENLEKENYLNFHLYGTEYIAIVKPVSEKNNFGLGWLVIYSSIQSVNQLQMKINMILLAILLVSAFIIVFISSVLAKKISSPFSTLNQHIRSIAERNFDTKIETPVYDELNDFVNNINTMSEKLETYDKAQKTFLQNASHEFRTPLMSIQSYAEGIKYNVMDSNAAADIIIDESKRLTHLVEELLYLSRLDTIEENYHFDKVDLNELMNTCIERMNGIALKDNITIEANIAECGIKLYADEEKLFRAITNIITNCLRYAESKISIELRNSANRKVEIIISDDGPGFDTSELSNIFERFYKGKKGNMGLGLAITKNVIEKHNGIVLAENSNSGAVFRIILPTV
jgi:signal transduction histidine kinase